MDKSKNVIGMWVLYDGISIMFFIPNALRQENFINIESSKKVVGGLVYFISYKTKDLFEHKTSNLIETLQSAGLQTKLITTTPCSGHVSLSEIEKILKSESLSYKNPNKKFSTH